MCVCVYVCVGVNWLYIGCFAQGLPNLILLLHDSFGINIAWKSIGDRLLGPCYLSRDDHNLKIRTRKQRTDVGKYSFVNRTVRNWNQLPAGVLATFPCKLNTFRKRIRNPDSY